MNKEGSREDEASAHFARLKAACEDLLALPVTERADALERLAERDAGLATEAARWLQHLRDSDLEPPAADEAGEIGPFRLLGLLGSGGMADVHLAERADGSFVQRVALKRMRGSLHDDDRRRRFQRERQLLARLQHRNIAHLIDGGVDPHSRPWLAMEYVEGEHLLQFARSRALDLDGRLTLLRRVCAAVAHAHAQLVVHRDLKPGNVLVDAQGEPRLLDFGIARLLDDEASDATRTGWHLLTPRYAAPEQLRGERAGTATDVHALGLLLFELVAEALSLAESGPVDLAAGQRRFDRLAGFRRLPRVLRQRVGGDLQRIVERATAAEPAQRYRTVSELDLDLEDLQRQRPLRSGVGSAGAQTRYLLRRYRWPLLSTAGVLLALALGALIAWQQAREAEAQRQRALAHVETLLDVLAAANPHRYAGREPRASDVLRDAAQRIQARADADPALQRRSLTEIGHGLLNLGYPADAERVLQQALAAAERDPASGPGTRLGILGLLANAVEGQAGRGAEVALQIEQLAAAYGVPAAETVDALARAGSQLSKAGRDDDAQRLFALAEGRLDALPDAALGVRENYWRQRGWAALRALRLEDAGLALHAADRLAAAAPARFSALRRAEGALLLLELALRQQDRRAAEAAWARAAPVFLGEYPAGHGERAVLQSLQAELQRLQGDRAGSLASLERAEPVLAEDPVGYASDLWRIAALRLRLALDAGDCRQVQVAQMQLQARSQQLQPLLLREQRSRDVLQQDAAGCTE